MAIDDQAESERPQTVEISQADLAGLMSETSHKFVDRKNNVVVAISASTPDFVMITNGDTSEKPLYLGAYHQLGEKIAELNKRSGQPDFSRQDDRRMRILRAVNRFLDGFYSEQGYSLKK